MTSVPWTIILTIAVLTVFLVFLTSLKYAIHDKFTRVRLGMTAFFVFIVITLTLSYWEFFFATLPYTIPAALVGMAVGHFVGVRAAEQRLSAHGIAHYMENFAHIHIHDFSNLKWWTLINFYSIMGALILINLVGLTTVIFHNTMPLTLVTSAFGAFLIGTIVPYLTHLWRIRTTQSATKNTSEKRNI